MSHDNGAGAGNAIGIVFGDDSGSANLMKHFMALYLTIITIRLYSLAVEPLQRLTYLDDV